MVIFLCVKFSSKNKKERSKILTKKLENKALIKFRNPIVEELIK